MLFLFFLPVGISIAWLGFYSFLDSVIFFYSFSFIEVLSISFLPCETAWGCLVFRLNCRDLLLYRPVEEEKVGF